MKKIESENKNNNNVSLNLPKLPEVEIAVLGAIINGGNHWWERLETIVGSEECLNIFWSEEARVIAKGVNQAVKAGTVNINSVIDEISESNAVIERFQPSLKDYLSIITINTPISSLEDFTSSVNHLFETYKTREVIISSHNAILKAGNKELSLSELVGELGDISSNNGISKGAVPFGDYIEKMDAEDNSGVKWRVSTGLSSIDKRIRGGYEPGRLYVIGARPKVGKTTFVINSVIEALCSEAVVLFVSLEINEQELFSKMLSCYSQRKQSEIQELIDGKRSIEQFDEEDRIAILECKEELKNSELYVLLAKDCTNGVSTVTAEIMSLKSKNPNRPIMVFIDYLQLLTSKDKYSRGRSRNEEIGAISRTLKLTAMQQEVAIITPSQINRAGAEGGMPSAHQLKDSGSIEQDADLIMILHRDSLDDADADPSIMRVNIAASRVGGAGEEEVGYYPESQLLRDLEDYSQEDY